MSTVVERIPDDMTSCTSASSVSESSSGESSIAKSSIAGRVRHLRIVGRRMLVGLLVTAMLSSALAVIYTKHLSRGLFAELQALQRVRNELNVEYGRLLLEQTTWSTHGRIEQIARTQLEMLTPSANTVMMVKP